MQRKIRFNKAPLLGDDLIYVEQAIKSGLTFGDGTLTREVESILQDQFDDAAGILLTSSCTHALEIIAILLDLNKDDEIIVPSFTFCSTASAFMMQGAKIIFADSEIPTMNIDPESIENLITPNTKAIVVVHYGGLGCKMEKIMNIAKENNLIVIEDNAHGFFGSMNQKQLGSFGDFSTLSFHGTKNISCGEGGALIVNNDRFLDRARVVREKGTNRFNFKSGKIKKYEWIDLGSSYLMSEISAGILKKQLLNSNKIQMGRKIIWMRYLNALSEWAEENDITLPNKPHNYTHAYHAFHMIFPSFETTKSFLKYMEDLGIEAISHYVPLHNAPIVLQTEKRTKELNLCPNSSIYSDRLVRLPLYYGLELSSVDYVIEKVLSFVVEKQKSKF